MIKVLCFAYLKEKVGNDRLVLEDASLTVDELLCKLEKEYAIDTKTIMVAINEEYAIKEDVIHAGDTVALIPPVSGG
ncbi:molybdopterin synthase sulfur carrier subunit [Pullulanibacillus camelliae]|uniref:Molybdopterin synthase sulfur carrier subunit n=1 Tax=Pullulanibacillus camelliae TaxID=1707096 RepID=A0A8J3DYN5_9BACL|nr:molybdopterin converting factor subunit 1 [Pullulanibacillus camelliae]GGE50494.1 molybdopterin synthase sulfur carrier subunit [Pullulanibacillus camelliae]